LAEEILQDVLVKVARRWSRVESARNRDAYVRRMLVNEFVSWRRKWARLVPAARIEVDRRDQEPDPAARIVERDLLHRELSGLPRRQQVVLALRYFDGLPDSEIAAALGCHESTVRAYAARGSAALRVQMATNLPIPNDTATGGRK
jgi:RNA polymerase sigma factor (sigma-70 family)